MVAVEHHAGGTGHPTGTHRDGSTNVARKPLRDDLYEAMRTAITGNAGFIYRGRDRQTGPQAGLGTLLKLEDWGWVRLVRVRVITPGTGQVRWEKAGGWLTRKGRTALRDEILRRGADMPARLARPASRPAPRPVTPAPAPRRPATTARPLLGAAAPARTATALMERPARSLTALVDPFTLIGAAGGADDDIPF